VKETEQFIAHLDSLHVLLNLIPDQNGKEQIMDKLTEMIQISETEQQRDQ
jgi:hypothetical protein